MNLSGHIDPELCAACGGKCCKSFALPYHKTLDPVYLSEVERWRLLDSGGKIRVEDRGDRYLVVVDFPCSELEDGKCRIYGGARPLLCRKYPHHKDDTECPFVK